MDSEDSKLINQLEMIQLIKRAEMAGVIYNFDWTNKYYNFQIKNGICPYPTPWSDDVPKPVEIRRGNPVAPVIPDEPEEKPNDDLILDIPRRRRLDD